MVLWVVLRLELDQDRNVVKSETLEICQNEISAYNAAFKHGAKEFQVLQGGYSKDSPLVKFDPAYDD